MKLNEVEGLIKFYSDNYRKSSLEKIEIGRLHLIDIKNNLLKYNSSENWEFSDNSGVCLFINDEKTVIHIIQAIKMGEGLTNHFTLSGFKFNWKKDIPKYILPLKVPDGLNFERHSLKDFLINHKKYYKI